MDKLNNFFSNKQSLNKINFAIYFFLIFIILIGVFARFYNIANNGLAGSDTVYYTTIALAQNNGYVDYQISKKVNRPVLFFFFTVAFKIFGLHDYSIKAMNASVDSINILLIFIICYIMSGKNIWLSFSSSIGYALLPMAVHLSRIELSHTISCFMVLLSFLFFIIFFQSNENKKKYIFILLSGFFTGFASLTHEELIFIAPGYIIFLIMTYISKVEKKNIINLCLRDAAIFCIAMLLVNYKVFFSAKIMGHVQNLPIIQEKMNIFYFIMNFFEKICRFFWNLISASTSNMILYLFLLLIILSTFEFLRKIFKLKQINLDVSSLFYLPCVLVGTYLVLYALCFKVIYVRLFLPFIPLLLIFLLIWYAKFLEKKMVKFPSAIVLLSTLTIIPFNIGHYSKFYEKYWANSYMDKWYSPNIFDDFSISEGYSKMIYRIKMVSWSKQVYDLLKNKVNDNKRLLLTPGILYSNHTGRRPLQADFYFGDNVISVFDHTEPLDELIKKYKIKYIIFTSYFLDYRWLNKKTHIKYEYGGKWSNEEPLILGQSYGYSENEYTIKKEYISLTTYLTSRKARLVYRGKLKNNGLTEVYELSY